MYVCMYVCEHAINGLLFLRFSWDFYWLDTWWIAADVEFIWGAFCGFSPHKGKVLAPVEVKFGMPDFTLHHVRSTLNCEKISFSKTYLETKWKKFHNSQFSLRYADVQL